jgi:hypothetical protein
MSSIEESRKKASRIKLMKMIEFTRKYRSIKFPGILRHLRMLLLSRYKREKSGPARPLISVAA